MTPYEIEIMLHHYASLAKFPRWTAPAYEATVAGLVTAGLLDVDDRPESQSNITATDRGRMFVEMLCATPLPIWSDPRLLTSPPKSEYQTR